MPHPIADDIRQQIWDLSQQQLSVSAIAKTVLLPPRTVRHLRALFRRQGQPTAPRFECCGRRSCTVFEALRQEALALRRDHSNWGAQRILAHWQSVGLVSRLPNPSTVRRWLRRAGLAGSPPPHVSATTLTSRASQPHEIWQMDAAECKSLRSGQKVCWLRLVDEASAATLFTRVFAQPRWASVAALAVQAALGEAFVRWGRPLGLRVDNGLPWVSPKSDLPSDMELWLAGLDISLHRNRPHVPQDNPVVERSQRTTADWAEPGKQDTAEQFQRRADEEDRIQREVYQFDGKQSRLEAYPELRWLGRAYALGSWEAVCWDHQGALKRLSAVDVQRLADKDGRVSMYDHAHLVGSDYRGQQVRVSFCAGSQEWVFSQEQKELRRGQAWYLSAEQIRSLQVGRRPDRAKQDRAAKAERSQVSSDENALPGSDRLQQ